MKSVTTTHEEKETLSVDVNLPGHDPRTTTPTFVHTKKALAARDGNRCWICGFPPEKVGPLEAHHYPIERSLAMMIDWNLVKKDCDAGEFGLTQAQRDAAKVFDWSTFDPADPYTFVDNMLVNGVLLDKSHHTKKDEGIHDMPHPLWVAQRYGKDGYQFSTVEVIHHEQE
jgi:hypothetical protein